VTTLEGVKTVLVEVLGIGEGWLVRGDDAAARRNLPELDSMAVCR
jgi:hypothetical protein